MSHRIDIESVVEQVVTNLLLDPDGRDIQTERDDLLAVIYAWEKEN